MANQSVTIFEKPLPHISLEDWHSRVTQIKNTADARRNDAFELRQYTQNMRNESNLKTDWDTYHNNARLTDRIAELKRWVTTMEECLARVEHEAHLLREEKSATERELDAMAIPLNIVLECLSMRDCRLGSEITYDEGDTELKKELCIIENNKALLQNQCQTAWEKLNRLDEMKFNLEREIAHKREALEIDTKQLNTDRNSCEISFKTDPLRVPKNSSSYDEWCGYTKHLKLLADNELEDTYTMRESLFVSRDKARNILRAQQERTDHTIRKRIFETQRARNELEWQKLKTTDEMAKFKKELDNLDQADLNKRNAQKLAETRLENRAQRSGMERCCDDVFKGLCDEVLQLRRTRAELVEKTNCAKAAYNALDEQSQLMASDLINKEHSLMTDLKVMDLRVRLKTGEFAEPKTQTDRNIVLTRMEQEIPPE